MKILTSEGLSRLVTNIKSELDNKIDYTKAQTLTDEEQLVARTNIGAEAADITILKEADVVNNTTSTSTTSPLSANVGKELQDQINDLRGIGRFLSIWNCATGLPETTPSTMPYSYRTGDYYRVGTVDSETNYRPTGSSYTGAASTVVETELVESGWTYYYDGSKWVVQAGTSPYTAGVGIDITNNVISFSTPVVTVSYSQITSIDPITVQLTNEQYDLISDDKVSIIKLDVSDLGMWSNYWEKTQLGTTEYVFVTPYYDEYKRGVIRVNKSTKIAVLSTDVSVVKCDESKGTAIDIDENITIVNASIQDIIDESSDYKPITPSNEIAAVKHSLGVNINKQANTTSWTDSEKSTAREFLNAAPVVNVINLEYIESEDIYVCNKTATEILSYGNNCILTDDEAITAYCHAIWEHDWESITEVCFNSMIESNVLQFTLICNSEDDSVEVKYNNSYFSGLYGISVRGPSPQGTYSCDIPYAELVDHLSSTTDTAIVELFNLDIKLPLSRFGAISPSELLIVFSTITKIIKDQSTGETTNVAVQVTFSEDSEGNAIPDVTFQELGDNTSVLNVEYNTSESKYECDMTFDEINACGKDIVANFGNGYLQCLTNTSELVVFTTAYSLVVPNNGAKQTTFIMTLRITPNSDGTAIVNLYTWAPEESSKTIIATFTVDSEDNITCDKTFSQLSTAFPDVIAKAHLDESLYQASEDIYLTCTNCTTSEIVFSGSRVVNATDGATSVINDGTGLGQYLVRYVIDSSNNITKNEDFDTFLKALNNASITNSLSDISKSINSDVPFDINFDLMPSYRLTISSSEGGADRVSYKAISSIANDVKFTYDESTIYDILLSYQMYGGQYGVIPRFVIPTEYGLAVMEPITGLLNNNRTVLDLLNDNQTITVTFSTIAPNTGIIFYFTVTGTPNSEGTYDTTYSDIEAKQFGDALYICNSSTTYTELMQAASSRKVLVYVPSGSYGSFDMASYSGLELYSDTSYALYFSSTPMPDGTLKFYKGTVNYTSESQYVLTWDSVKNSGFDNITIKAVESEGDYSIQTVIGGGLKHVEVHDVTYGFAVSTEGVSKYQIGSFNKTIKIGDSVDYYFDYPSSEGTKQIQGATTVETLTQVSSTTLGFYLTGFLTGAYIILADGTNAIYLCAGSGNVLPTGSYVFGPDIERDEVQYVDSTYLNLDSEDFYIDPTTKKISVIGGGGSGSVTAITAGTGLAGGTITSTGTISLNDASIVSLAKADTALQPNTTITGATKTKITYDSKGLVTAGEDLTASDIPEITIDKLSDISVTSSEINNITNTEVLVFNSTYNPVTNKAATMADLNGISGPMVFKGTLGEGGTITELPTASQSTAGYTYKVITAGTYDGKTAKVGDLFICRTCGTDPETYEWILIPSGDEPSGTVTNIATGTGLTGGPITDTGTIALSNETISTLDKLSGVTTNVQTQLDSKSSTGHTHTIQTSVSEVTAGSGIYKLVINSVTSTDNV